MTDSVRSALLCLTALNPTAFAALECGSGTAAFSHRPRFVEDCRVAGKGDSCATAVQGADLRSARGEHRSSVTFNEIAPILFSNCAECHHPGGSGPFSLLTYVEARKRAGQIAAVTARRYMPPWPPEPGYVEIAGERRLTDEQIQVLQEWVAQGAPEGDTAHLPPVPTYHEGWELGEPDLVVKMARPYMLRAGGSDAFRNFVFRLPIASTRYLSAVEILPGNKKVVHHANIVIDRTQWARHLDGQDGEIGFPGMDVQVEDKRFEPDSHFLFWKPGTVPVREPDDMALRIDPGTDLILNIHLFPSGKPEPIQPSIGLYFTDHVPTKFPMLLQLEHDGALDIPPGVKDFVVTDELQLPADVQVLGVYPHAHYLGKDVQGYATLPDGTRQWLIRIKDWNIGWQAVYRFARPIFLPKGSTLAMRYTYDNSDGNVRNPNHPPLRVMAGNRSSDEMAHLWIQVLPPHPEDRKLLQEALMRQRLRKYPDDLFAHANLGAVLQSMGRLDEAVLNFGEALRIKPDDATVHNNLGGALVSMGRLEEATSHFREALRSSPEYMDAHYNLGNSLLAAGKPEEAIPHFREVLRVNPDDANVHNDLGSAFVMQGKLAEAAREFERALRLDPENAYAYYNLGYVLARQGKLAEAQHHLEHALRLKADDADTHNELGSVYARQGNLAQAIDQFEAALRLNPENADAQDNLRRARAQLGRN
jgi:Flp pilus assembly protein TadD